MIEAIKQSLHRRGLTMEQAAGIIERGTIECHGKRVQLHVAPSDMPLAGNMVIEAQL